MSCNVGGIERTIRILLGLALLAVAYLVALPGWGMGVAYVAGFVALVTGAIGFCPAWKLFGLNTCPTKPAGQQ